MFVRLFGRRSDRIRRPFDLAITLAQIALFFVPTPGVQGSDTEAFHPDAILLAARDILSESTAPGAALAVVSRDRVVWAGGIGLTQRGDQRRVSEQTLFRTGAISEILIALAVLRLQEQGLLDVQDPVASLLPEVEVENPWAATDPLRLVHLLEHTSGLEDLYLSDRIQHTGRLKPFRQQLLELDGPLRVRWRPGTLVAYSRRGFALAALVVEKTSGRGCQRYIAEEILEPLSMSTATFSPGPSLAPGHVDGRVVSDLGVSLLPVEGLAATASDLASLVQLLISQGHLGDRQIFSPASMRRMVAPSSSLAARSGILTGYGWALKNEIYDGWLLRGHSGRSRGYRCRLEYFPRSGKGLVVLINADDDNALQRLVHTVREALVGQEARPPVAPSEIPPWRIASLSGYYRPIAPSLELERLRDEYLGVIRLELEGSSLRLVGGPARGALIPMTDRRFRLPDSPLPGAVFTRQDGMPLLIGTEEPFEGGFLAISSWRVWTERTLMGAALILMGLGLLLPFSGLTRFRRASIPFAASFLPGLATLTFLGQLILLNNALQDPLATLARPTPWSMSIWLLGNAFFLLSAASLVASGFGILRSRSWGWYRALHLACSAANVGLVVVLWRYDLLALRTWA